MKRPHPASDRISERAAFLLSEEVFMSGWGHIHVEEGSGFITYRVDGYYPGVGELKKKAKKHFFTDDDMPNRIILSQANDTSGSGWAALYNIQSSGKWEKVDEYSGYEGARGKDVMGDLRSEHDIQINIWKWGADEKLGE